MNLRHFPTLAPVPRLHHAITTRDGGFSSGEFASLNLAFHVGDEAATVRRNRRALAQELGFDANKLVAAQQVHGARSTIVGAADAGRGALDWNSALPDTDAIITAQTDLPLLILVADCAPILLFEPQARVLALVHAGWRGALAGVASNAVAAMQSLGAQTERIRAGIGPCLCARHLEVGPEVAALFEDKTVLEAHGAKYRLDLRSLIWKDLQSVGVSQIESLADCPGDDENLFSHRGQNGTAGRFGIVAWMGGQNNK